ncbi:linker for activation of T-cells family member 2-like isoform X2 [Narcine bancroftii]|uniref:linker for activation of T-cells family member 2-like isoform X2 n=1 Tax=Narcine bancroftii TaxID=1343680 RepID=UPI003831F85D
MLFQTANYFPDKVARHVAFCKITVHHESRASQMSKRKAEEGSAIIREETRRKPQSIHMNETMKGFEVARSYTVSRSGKKASVKPKTENLPASNVAISTACQDISPSYMNIDVGNHCQLDQEYINPLSEDYYCSPRKCSKSADDDDSNSYENVQINKVESQTSVNSGGSYENCEFVMKWGLQEKPEERSDEKDEDEDEDEEPDYVNTVPCPSL